MRDAHRHLSCPSKGATMSSLRPNPVKSTPLRDQMMHEMQLHRLAPGTQQSYAKAITDLARYYWRSPDQLTPPTSAPICTISSRSASSPLVPAMSRPPRSVFSTSRPSAGPRSNSTSRLAPIRSAYPTCSVSKPWSVSLPPWPIRSIGLY